MIDQGIFLRVYNFPCLTRLVVSMGRVDGILPEESLVFRLKIWLDIVSLSS